MKWLFNRLPKPLNSIYAYSLGLLVNTLNIIKYTLLLKPMVAISPLLNYRRKRGMSVMHDLIYWMGVFPYEFATYDLLERYLNCRGFELVNGRAATSLGCHEQVFQQIEERLKD